MFDIINSGIHEVVLMLSGNLKDTIEQNITDHSFKLEMTNIS